jgi:hypothetical protein
MQPMQLMAFVPYVRRLLVGAVICALAFPPSLAWAGAEITAIEVETASDGAVVTIQGNVPPSFGTFMLKGPSRLVVDFAGTVHKVKTRKQKFNNPYVKGVDSYPLAGEKRDTTRVVIEIGGEVTYEAEAVGTGLQLYFRPGSEGDAPAVAGKVKIKGGENRSMSFGENEAPSAGEEVPVAMAAPGAEPEQKPAPKQPEPAAEPVKLAKIDAPKTVDEPQAAPAPAPKAEPKPTPAPAPSQPANATPWRDEDEPAPAPAPAASTVAKKAAPKPAPAPEPVAKPVAQPEPKSEPEPELIAIRPEPPAEEPQAVQPPPPPPPPAPEVAAPVVPPEDREIPPAPAPVVAYAEPEPAPQPVAPKPMVAQTPAEPEVPAAPEPYPSPESQPQPPSPQADEPPVVFITDEPEPGPAVAETPAETAEPVPARAPELPKRPAPAPAPTPAPIVVATPIQPAPAQPPAQPSRPAPRRSITLGEEPAAAAPAAPTPQPVAQAPSQPLPAQPSAEPAITASVVADNVDVPPTPGVRTLDMVGFKLIPNATRVFIRLDGVGRFELDDRGSSIFVTLNDTKFGSRRNARPLYTNFFPGSAVEVVQATKLTNTTTRVEIKLKGAVPHRLSRQGNMILFDFPLVAPQPTAAPTPQPRG